MISRCLKNPAFLAAFILMAFTALGMSAGIKAMGIYLRKLPIYAAQGRELRAIPVETENWIREGTDRIEEAETENTLGTKNYVTRRYVMKNPPEGKKKVAIELHCAYYTGMIDTVPHVPERCFVAAGLQMMQSPRIVTIPFDTKGWAPDNNVPEEVKGRIVTARTGRYSDKPGMAVRLPRDAKDITMRAGTYKLGSGVTMSTGYFFVANGGSVPNAEQVRLLAFDLKADYAYFLKIQVNTASGETPEELAVLTASLLDDLFPEIMRCVPDWVEVDKGTFPDDNPRKKKMKSAGA